MIKKFVLLFGFIFSIPLSISSESVNSVLGDKEYEGKRTIPLYFTTPPKKLIDGAKVVLVSGYKSDGDASRGDTAKVDIDLPNSKILLVLTSNDRVNWEVTKTKSTNIIGVITSSYEVVPTITTNFDARGYYVKDLSYVIDAESINFEKVLSTLNVWLGVEKVDVFLGNKSIPKQQKISQLDTPSYRLTLAGAPVEKPKNDFEFELYDKNLEVNKLTLVGQKVKSKNALYGNKVVMSSNGEIYIASQTGIKIFSKNASNKVSFDIPNAFPKLSGMPAIAYDSKRKIVAIVNNRYKSNFIYRFDTVKNEWIDFKSLKDTQLQNLTYDNLSDRYVGWSYGELVFMTPIGDVISSRHIKPLLQGLGRLNNPSVSNLVIKANGDQVALIHLECGAVSRIWLYDLLTNSSMLTYKNSKVDKNIWRTYEYPSPYDCYDGYPG